MDGLDWGSLIPSKDGSAPAESATFSQKSGELPANRGTLSSYSGNKTTSNGAVFGDRSPRSPRSPRQKKSMDTEESAGVWGWGETNCARETTFVDLGELVDLGDLRTCEQCGNLTEAGRCLAAARREIVASPNYAPIRLMPKRCEGYLPSPADPDQRPGRERWPGLG